MDPLPEPQPALTQHFIPPMNRRELVYYCEALRLTHGTVKLLGLPDVDERNDDLPISALFVEPHVSRTRLGPEQMESDPAPALESLLAHLAEFPRTVILGDPGAGKSTVVNWLCTALAQPLENAVSATLGRLVPFPFILRELPLGVPLTWDSLLKQFLARPVAAELRKNPDLAQTLFSSGQALLLFDGVDEVGSVARREALRGAIWECWRRFPRTRSIVTSRVVGYEECEFELGRKEVERARIAAAADEDLLDFASRNVERREAARRHLAPFTDAQLRQFVQNWYRLREPSPALASETATNLIQAIQADLGTREIARIPNLLTLISLIYRVRAKLPDGRSHLYGTISAAYLKTIDEYRRVEHERVAYTLAEKMDWLGKVGWEMQLRRASENDANVEDESAALASADDIRAWLAEAMHERFGGMAELEAAEFLNHLQRRSGLLLARGERQFAFLHLSFQEFFAAQFLVSRIQTPWWALREFGTPSVNGDTDANSLSLAELRKCTAQPVWQEVFVFLFESLARDWAERLAEGLFLHGKQMTEDGDRARWHLAARIAGNPHTSFGVRGREVLMGACWKWELAAIRSEPQYSIMSRRVPRHLLGRHDTFQTGWSQLVAEAKTGRILRLWLSQAPDIRDLQDVGTLWHLEEFALVGSKALSDLSPLRDLHSLRTLDLRGCTAVSDLSPLMDLRALNYLNVGGCVAVSDLSALRELLALAHLDLSGCTAVSDLTPLREMRALKRLYLGGCTGVSDLSALRELRGLNQLYLSGCTGVSDLSALRELRGLNQLYLSGCTAVSDLNALRELQALTHLDLSRCTAVSDLSPLREMRALMDLSLSGCAAVRDLRPLLETRALLELDLNRCTALTDLRPLGELSQLNSLILRECAGVSDLSPLRNLQALAYLDLEGCTSVSDLGDVRYLVGLEAIDLRGCSALRDVRPLGGLMRLRQVILIGTAVTDVSMLPKHIQVIR